MANKNKARRLGQATLEMTLVGIPIIFTLISIVEMSRGMWIYHTLAYSIKEATRYTIVHGQNCSVPPNSCAVTVSQIAAVIKNAGIGLDPSLLQVQMQSLGDDTGLLPLSTLLGKTDPFPTGAGAAVKAPITFSAQYPFNSAIAMFWPGVNSGSNFMSVIFPATSRESVQF